MPDENHGPATPEEISSLEEFIPTRLTCLTLLQASVSISMAEFNLLHTLLPAIMGYKVVQRHLYAWFLYILNAYACIFYSLKVRKSEKWEKKTSNHSARTG